jgi:hypothetical protein
VTRQASFGDFLDAARSQLAAAVGPAPAGGEDLRETAQSIRRVVVVLRRYAQDIAGGFGTPPGQLPEPPQPWEPWEQAAADAQRELHRAVRYLTAPVTVKVNLGTRPSSGAARRMDGAAVILQAGHELLDTHFAAGPDGTRGHHTEWAAALASRALRRALLAEVAALAGQAAASSDQLAAAPGWRGAPGPRRALRQASYCLQTVHQSVQGAQQGDRVPAEQRELLRAIPGSSLPPRRQPRQRDTIAALHDGTITSAQRIRRAAWQATASPGSAPAVTITSLRQTAAASTLTSHHCQILLQAAADRVATQPMSEAGQDIAGAAEAAGKARASWLTVARTLGRITIDSAETTTLAAAESSDLALWTGRLAYADPAWTLASGPAHQPRAPRHLAPEPADVPVLISTVHHALDSLQAAADAEHDQVQAAAGAGRILVPARSLPLADTTQPFTLATRSRVRDLLGIYRTAGQDSADAATAVSAIAESLAAPSRVLATARAAAGTSHLRRRAPKVITPTGPDWPGPLETSMHDLGVTSPWLIQRAVALDRASAQLIMDAAAEPGASHQGTSAELLSKSATTAEIVHDILASGDPRAAALLQTAGPQPQIPEREP